MHLGTSGPASSEGIIAGVWRGKGWTAREVVASVEEGEGALYFSGLTLPALRFAFYT